VCVCVGEIISLPWFSKELENDLSKNNCFRGVILILLVRESIFVGWGSPFPIVLVPRYKLSLCHTLIKPDLLGFPGIGVFACGLRDHKVRINFKFGFKFICCSDHKQHQFLHLFAYQPKFKQPRIKKTIKGFSHLQVPIVGK